MCADGKAQKTYYIYYIIISTLVAPKLRNFEVSKMG